MFVSSIHLANAPGLRKSSGGIVLVGPKVCVDRKKTKRSKELITS
jgi:hypothetical protein